LPLSHVAPPVHRVPQAPQLASSVIGSLHEPPQLFSVAWQQTPLWQVVSGGVLHVVAQLPQCASSLLRSTQVLPQRVVPAGQHRPFWQVPVPQSMPH
jgi:hypothetical protein